MGERRRARSLEESLAEPPAPSAEPAPEVDPERPKAPDPPVDLSASVRALEARQVQWIRQRERWRAKVTADEARASEGRRAP